MSIGWPSRRSRFILQYAPTGFHQRRFARAFFAQQRVHFTPRRTSRWTLFSAHARKLLMPLHSGFTGA
jgi:hypothetical protein